LRNNNGILLSVKLKLTGGNSSDIKARMDELNSLRKEKQPLEYPSAGSAFKRPEGFFAGKLIADSGLRGFTIGAAQVSKKHAGFIINLGKATAEDVCRLIEHVQKTVYKKFQVLLEPEIKIIS
jgi:UDP-N-acetylmuramate dehydrogenase